MRSMLLPLPSLRDSSIRFSSPANRTPNTSLSPTLAPALIVSAPLAIVACKFLISSLLPLSGLPLLSIIARYRAFLEKINKWAISLELAAAFLKTSYCRFLMSEASAIVAAFCKMTPKQSLISVNKLLCSTAEKNYYRRSRSTRLSASSVWEDRLVEGARVSTIFFKKWRESSLTGALKTW